MQTQDDSVTARRRLNVLGEFAECIARNLVSVASLEPARADVVAVEVVGNFEREFGGESFYIPKGVEKTRSERDQQIYTEKLAGEHADDLARKYSISRVRIFQIVARCREQDEATAKALESEQAKQTAAAERARNSAERANTKNRTGVSTLAERISRSQNQEHPWKRRT